MGRLLRCGIIIWYAGLDCLALKPAISWSETTSLVEATRDRAESLTVVAGRVNLPLA